MRGYITNLAAILRKAQGVIDAATNHQPIDIGGEVLAIRQEGDALNARIAALEALLAEAPHASLCAGRKFPTGYIETINCDCFKSRA